MTGKKSTPKKSASLSLTTEQKSGYSWDSVYYPNLQSRPVVGELDWPSIFGVLKGQSDDWFGQVAAYRASIPELEIDSSDPSNNGHFVDQIYSAYAKNEHA